MQVGRIKYVSAISLNERIRYLKLLFRWQGSVWKLLWADFVCFIFTYVGVTLLYRCYLINHPFHKSNFESLVSYMNKVGALVPLSFLLGFFVSTILGRWWEIVMAIPWMSQPAFAFQTLITGKNESMCRAVRLTLVRYMNLSWILSLMSLSRKVKVKFQPKYVSDNGFLCFKKKISTLLSIRERMDLINKYDIVQKYYGGQLIKEEEIAVFEKFESLSTEKYKPDYVVPLMWATRVLEKAVNEGYIVTQHHYLELYNIIQTFRGALGTLSIYKEFNIPLVYTQVVIIVVYSFLISEIFSQQFVEMKKQPTVNFVQSSQNASSIQISNNFGSSLQAYFPIFTLFKFFIYMGWFKIGLNLVNPFGMDKSDLPLDSIMDYNLRFAAKVSPSDDSYFPDYLTSSFDKEERFERLLKYKNTSTPRMGKISEIQETNIDEVEVKSRKVKGDGSKEMFEIA